MIDPEVFLTRLFSRGQCKQVIQQEKNSPVWWQLFIHKNPLDIFGCIREILMTVQHLYIKRLVTLKFSNLHTIQNVFDRLHVSFILNYTRHWQWTSNSQDNFWKIYSFIWNIYMGKLEESKHFCPPSVLT